MNNIDKEILRKKILECSLSTEMDKFDFSLFDDNDVDVFVSKMRFESFQNKYYVKLSDKLKDNKLIVEKAVKIADNIKLIDKKHFKDKEVMKQVLWARNEKFVPIDVFDEDMINYAFLTCSRFSVQDMFKPLINKYLKKETVINYLEKINTSFSDCLVKNSIFSADPIYLPPHMLCDYDIVKNLFVTYFKMVKDNVLIDKKMINEIIQNYSIENLPPEYFSDTDLIKSIIAEPSNYNIFNSPSIKNIINSYDDDLVNELIHINPNILKCYNFEMSFNVFKNLVEENFEYLFQAKSVSSLPDEQKKLFDFMTDEKIIDYFKIDDSYDFSMIYGTQEYYKNPIIFNKFLILKIAEIDGYLFNAIPESLVNDNELMYKLFIEYKVPYNRSDSSNVDYKIYESGGMELYLKSLKIEHDLNTNLSDKKTVKFKI